MINPFYNPFNILKKRNAKKRRLEKKISLLKQEKEAQSQLIKTLENKLNEVTESHQNQISYYQQKLHETEEKNRRTIEKARKVIDEISQIATNRLLEALLQSKPSEIVETPYFQEHLTLKRIFEAYRKQADSYRQSAEELAEAKEEIEKLKSEITEAKANTLTDIIKIYSQTSQDIEKAPLSIYTSTGKQLYTSPTFRTLIKKYASEKRFAIENLLTDTQFRERLAEEGEIKEELDRLRVRFVSYSHGEEQIAISVSLSLAGKEEGKRRYRVIKSAELRALSLLKNVWEECKSTLHLTGFS